MRGLLFSQMEPPPDWDDGFNDWYDNEHVPERVAIRDIESATRYTALEGSPRYSVCYHLADLGVLESDVYLRVRGTRSERTAKYLDAARGFTRYTAGEVLDEGPRLDDDALLFVHAFDVPHEVVTAFDEWYQESYVSHLGSDVRARYYAIRPEGIGPCWNRLALYHLSRPPTACVRSQIATAGQRAVAHGGVDRTWLYEPRFTAR